MTSLLYHAGPHRTRGWPDRHLGGQRDPAPTVRGRACRRIPAVPTARAVPARGSDDDALRRVESRHPRDPPQAAHWITCADAGPIARRQLRRGEGPPVPEERKSERPPA